MLAMTTSQMTQATQYNNEVVVENIISLHEVRDMFSSLHSRVIEGDISDLSQISFTRNSEQLKLILDDLHTYNSQGLLSKSDMEVVTDLISELNDLVDECSYLLEGDKGFFIYDEYEEFETPETTYEDDGEILYLPF